jgi:rhodanese-related sulfurtransferase
LDVRKKEDFSKKHIEGSINLPLELLEKNKQEIPLGKIVIIDENPVRSFQAAVRLYDMNMAGNYCLQESLSILEKITKEKINEDKQATP